MTISHPQSAAIRRLYRIGRYGCAATPTPLAHSLLRFKYGADRGAGHALRRLFAVAAKTLPPIFEIVVPVPLHPTRLRRRGFNQSAWLARGAATACRVPVEVRALKRVAEGAAQAASSASQRRTLSDAFRATPRYISGKNVLLVDDVYTTGTTARDAAMALLAAGAARVSVAILLLAGSDDE